jgi:uncharacterized protein YydD (DUF2326 family)
VLLTKLYSEPEIFSPVTFKLGLNLIFGKKEVTDNPASASLNSIGKSLLLDFLDFALLASYDGKHNERLFATGNRVVHSTIILQFKINAKEYIIRRSFEHPKTVEFGEIDSEIEQYDILSLKPLLCDLIFANDPVFGLLDTGWYRNLITFFLKIHKPGRDRFLDPLDYLPEATLAEIQIYLLFMMAIDNSLAVENFQNVGALRETKRSIAEAKSFLQNEIDIDEAREKIVSLKSEIFTLEKAIEQFKLGQEYDQAESEADAFTAEIKSLLIDNHQDKHRIANYTASIKKDSPVQTDRIAALYAEVSAQLGIVVKKTLEEAVNFRKALLQSRKSFFKTEINALKVKVDERIAKINELESKRAGLFSFLDAKLAMNDLKEAFRYLTKRQTELAEIEGTVNKMDKLAALQAELEVVSADLKEKYLQFLSTTLVDQIDMYQKIRTIYEGVFGSDSTDGLAFLFKSALKKDAKFEIEFAFSGMLGKGKNQGRTLIFDLAVLLRRISIGLHGPLFLVHDGIFDGMDKSHFIALETMIDKWVSDGFELQYIATLNEEGSLSDEFGDASLFDPSNLEAQAVAVLSPNNKLLGFDFS